MKKKTPTPRIPQTSDSQPLASIDQLRPDMTIRHKVTGMTYVVKTIDPKTRSAFATREVTVNNPSEWVLVKRTVVDEP